MKRLRIYIDTSVVGGCLDREFAEESLALLELAREGRVILLVSTLLADELREAPAEVRAVFESLAAGDIEGVKFTEEARVLRDQYLREGILGKASKNDALHVALATCANADMIVSWNFKHIVHFEKMRGFNSVNMKEGYPSIEIHSPKEIV